MVNIITGYRYCAIKNYSEHQSYGGYTSKVGVHL